MGERRAVMKIWKMTATISLVFIFAVMPSAGQAGNALVFKGCSIARSAFMSEVAVAYEKAAGKKIGVTGGGATLGIRATAAGDADIGGACRPPLPEFFDEEKGVYMTHVAWDALVFITHPSNPVDNISLQQARDILSGKITNWKQVGGTDRPIIVVFRSQAPEHSGKVSGVGYMTRLMLFNDPDIDFVKNALFFRYSAEIERTVAKVGYTLGITGISSAKKRNLKVLNLNGIEPAKKNIASAEYPLFRPLYLVTKGKPAGEAKAFIDWLIGKDGQKIISDLGIVNLKEGRGLKAKFRFWQHTELITNYK